VRAHGFADVRARGRRFEVLLGDRLVLGQVLLGLVGPLMLALFLEELDDLCLVQLHSSS
jgi:hypothetical protein